MPKNADNTGSSGQTANSSSVQLSTTTPISRKQPHRVEYSAKESKETQEPQIRYVHLDANRSLDDMDFSAIHKGTGPTSRPCSPHPPGNGHGHECANACPDKHIQINSFQVYELFETPKSHESVNKYTVKRSAMPSWYVDNSYIWGGYRRFTHCYKGCFMSLFYLHNETGNVYTHLIGALLFVGFFAAWFLRDTPVGHFWSLAGFNSSISTPLAPDSISRFQKALNASIDSHKHLFPSMHDDLSSIWWGLGSSSAFMDLQSLWVAPTTGWQDILVIGTFLTGGIVCLLLSAAFHLVCCHSKNVLIQWNKADYIGIIVLIVASFVPPLYYGFYCMPMWRSIYLSIIISLGTVMMFVSLSQRFSTPQWRFLRTMLFISLGCFGFVPIGHGILIFGYKMSNMAVSISHILTMGALYIIGAMFYVLHIPERWFPGTFDIWGHSHQIWHILVLIAAIVHYVGIYKSYWFWHVYNPTCSIPSDLFMTLF